MRNETTQINMLGKLLRNVSEHCVFLSATPIHLKNKDLLSQLSLLDPGQYALNNPSEALRSFEKLIEANRPIIQAREIILNDKNISDAVENIQEAINNDLLSESVGLKNILNNLKNINKNPSVEIRSDLASKLEKSNLLSNIITRTRRRDVNELSIIRRVYPKIIDMSFVEEDFYETVTKAVQKYAEGKKINQKFLLASPQRMMTSSMYGALKHWRKNLSFNLQLDYEDNEDQIPNNNDNDEENYRPLISYLAEETKKFSLNELYSNDTKFNSLRDEILKLNKEFPDEKIVLFSAFKPTLNYLEKRLVDDNLVCFIIHGNTDDRNETLQKFENAEGKAILLSSEVGSEGLDLQFCKILINYDLPWNPMRVEQRIGRIDRVGQSSDYVSILNFINNNTIDQRIWERPMID